MAKAHWLIKQLENGSLFATKASHRGKLFHCTPVEELDTPDNLSGRVDMALESDKTIVLVDDFALTKGNILDLQIHKKIDQLALFGVGERIITAHRFLGKQRHLQRLSVIATPEELTVAGMQKIIAGKKRKLRSCVATVAAIAALLQKIGSESFIVLCINEDRAFTAGVQNGAVLFLQSVPLEAPAFVESGVAAHAIGFARQSMARDFEFDNCRLVCLGTGRDNFDFASLNEDDWIPDWSHCLKADSNDIMLYPELFGLLFITPDCYSFLPPAYRVASYLQNTASLLAMGAAAGSLILGGLAYFQYQENQPLLLQLAKERSELSRAAGDIRRLIPDQETFRKIETFNNIRGKADSEPSAAILLAEIARVLPANVHIVELGIIRDTARGAEESGDMDMMGHGMDMGGHHAVSGQGEQEQHPGEQLLNRQLVVNLMCTSQGEFSDVRARFNRTVAGLSSVFLLEDVDWKYDEITETGYFSGKLSKPERQ